MLAQAGNHVREEVLSGFIRLMCHTPELQAYTVQKLYSALKNDVSQESLTLAGVWGIGEFGDILLSSGGVDENEAPYDISEADLVSLFQSVLASPYVNSTIRQYILTATAKLSTRFGASSAEQATLLAIIASFQLSSEVESQQRAVEFHQLLTGIDESTRSGVLERMPLPEIKATVLGTVSERRAVGSTKAGKDVRLTLARGRDAHPLAQSLLDLTSDDAESSRSSKPAVQTTQDLLADLFGSTDLSSTPAPAAAPAKSNVNDIFGLFDSDSAPAAAPPQATAPSPAPEARTVQAFEGHGLRISLSVQKDAKNPLVSNIVATFEATATSISGINFQVAVPKVRCLSH
jgi:AP-1 complex subunit gamma-1